ncbi:hypothetical protein [Nocardia araoensis]|uniref:hypothetical protein n=1 Tax=Nocardia araoensis TaxID=228600 RepID=UPI0002F1FDD9|nr:hypothetical protein [Nocardia araoensis]
MSTAISHVTRSVGAAEAEGGRRAADPVSVQDDLGYESARRLLCGGARPRALTPAHRSAVDRRPPGARPGAGMVAYDRGARTSARRRSRGEHPMRRVEQAQIGFAALAVAALLTASAVVGLIAVAHVRAGEWGGGPGRSVPAVVDGSSVPGSGNSR